MPRSIIESASDVGARKLRVFLDMILPLSLNDFLIAITFVFMGNVASFTTPCLGSGEPPACVQRASRWRLTPRGSVGPRRCPATARGCSGCADPARNPLGSDGTAAGPPTHRTRCGRPPAPDSSWRCRDDPPGSSCTRRLPWCRAGLLREPRCCFFQDFSLFSQGAILASELVQLLTLIGCQAVATYPRVAIGLSDPVADDGLCRLKLPGKAGGVAPRAGHVDDLLAKLRGIGGSGSGHVSVSFSNSDMSTKSGQLHPAAVT
jgi:hypothetical protein